MDKADNTNGDKDTPKDTQPGSVKPNVGLLIEVCPEEFVVPVAPIPGLSHLPRELVFRREGEGPAATYAADLDLRYFRKSNNGHASSNGDGKTLDEDGSE